MPIINKPDLKEVNLPFSSFQPNTIISSEQVNDNNDEIAYRTNKLIQSFLLVCDELGVFEGNTNSLKTAFDSFVSTTNNNVTDIRAVAETNRSTLNTRITTEVGTLNNTINTKENTLNGRISTEVNTLNNTINTKDSENKTEIAQLKTGKADGMELKNTLLYLKSGATTLSVADLAGLGGGVSRSATNIGFGQAVQVSDWTLDATTGMYKVKLEHSLTTSTPLVVYYDETTGFSMFDVSKVIDANTVDVYNDVAINTYISVINGSANIELVQAILDDDNITPLRTWSSEKIRQEIDGKTVDLTPLETRITTNETSILSLTESVNGAKSKLATNCANFVDLIY